MTESDANAAALDQALARLKADPRSIETACELIDLMLRLDRATDARHVHQQVARDLRAHPELLTARAKIELALGNLPQSLKLLGEAARGAPDDPVPLISMARISLAAGREEDAFEHARQAFERADESLAPDWARTLIAVLEQGGERSRAAVLVDRLLASHADAPEVHEAIGLAAYDVGDPVLACEHLAEAALAGRKEAFHPLGMVIWSQLRNPDLAGAVHLLALLEGDLDPANLRELALIDLLRDQRARAADLMRASLASHEGDPPPIFAERWWAREGSGRSIETVLKEFEGATPGDLAWACARFLLDRKLPEKALRWTRRALELDPNMDPARVHLIRELHDEDDEHPDLAAHLEALDWDRLPDRVRHDMEQIRDDVQTPEGGAVAGRSSGAGTDGDHPAIGIGRPLDPSDGRAPPWIGSTADIDRLLRLLARPSRRSVLIVGGGGVGKTALVRAAAARIAAGEGPAELREHSFWVIPPIELQTDIKYLGEWQSKISELADKLKSRGKTIVHMPRLHQLLGAGTTEHHEIDMLSALAPMIEADELVVVGETLPGPAARMLRARPELERAFTRVALAEPTRAETRKILTGACGWIGGTGPAIDAAAVDRTIDLCARFQRHRGFPAKGLDLLRRTVESVGAQGGEQVGSEEVAHELSASTGLPRFLLLDSEPLDLRRATAFFAERVLGQERAIEALVDTVARIKTDLHDPQRPLACYLFAGPTGVGKTEAAKTLAAFLFGDEGRLIRLDMSEFGDPSAPDRLIMGDPRREGSRGQLTGPVRDQPLSVLLLDEVEKAHPRVFDLLLQVLGEGRLTDALGETVDFRECVILMTSNLGYERGGDGAFGFHRDRDEAEAAALRTEIERFFRPELFNRIDRVVHFYGLSLETMRKIALREIGRCLTREGIVRRGVVVETDPGVADLILERGQSARYGARQLKRAVEDLVAVPLARLLSEASPGPDDTVRLLPRDQRVEAQIVRDEPEPAAAPPPRRPARARRHGSTRQAHQRIARLQERLAGIEGALGIDALRARADDLRREMTRPTFWDDATRSTAALRELARVTHLIDRHKGMERKIEEALLLVDLVTGGRKERQGELERRIHEMEELSEGVELETVLTDPGDARAAYLVVAAAQRGAAAQEWAAALLKMYRRWARHRGYESELQGERLSVGGEGRAAILRIDGPNAYGLLRSETGTHRRIGSRAGDGGREVTVARVLVLPDPASAERAEEPSYRSARADELRFLDKACGVLALRGPRREWRIYSQLPRDAALTLGRELIRGLAERRASIDDELGRVVRNVGLRKQRFVRDPRTGHQVSDVGAVLDGRIDEFILAALLGAEAGARQAGEPMPAQSASGRGSRT